MQYRLLRLEIRAALYEIEFMERRRRGPGGERPPRSGSPDGDPASAEADGPAAVSMAETPPR